MIAHFKNYADGDTLFEIGLPADRSVCTKIFEEPFYIHVAGGDPLYFKGDSMEIPEGDLSKGHMVFVMDTGADLQAHRELMRIMSERPDTTP